MFWSENFKTFVQRRMMRPPTLTSSGNSGDSDREELGKQAYILRNYNQNWFWIVLI